MAIISLQLTVTGLKKFHINRPARFAGMKNIQIRMPFLEIQPGHRLIFIILGIKCHFTVTRANLSIYFESKHNTSFVFICVTLRVTIT